MIKFLIYIFNHSISAGYVPDKLKHARIIFLQKGNKSQYVIQNYRPISLLDVHGKILDKILNNRLTRQLELKGLTNDRQHGFRQGRGTHTALALFHETITNNINNRQTTDIILRDVEKAFDKVWHTGIKYKILQIGLHTCFTKTLSDYLTDRTATIQIGDYTGPTFSLNSGVPQGACLSPTLYSFYTHDMPEPLPNTDYIAFADDITQITSGRYKYRDAARNTEHAIQQIDEFENKWKIKTNRSKFQIIPISRRNTTDIYLNDNEILQYTNEGKILGLTFNRRGILPQVKIRTAVALNNLSKLHRFTSLNINNKLKLYNALIRSALIYPSVILNIIAKSPMLKLQSVQNKALKY